MLVFLTKYSEEMTVSAVVARYNKSAYSYNLCIEHHRTISILRPWRNICIVSLELFSRSHSTERSAVSINDMSVSPK